MGCGKSKSKQDVATGNTIITTRKDTSENNVEKPDEKIETAIHENITPANKETNQDVKQDDPHETDKDQVDAPQEVKEIPENTGLLNNDHEEAKVIDQSTARIDRNENNVGDGVVVEEAIVESSGEGLISRDSLNHYSSVRSEMSTEYGSPRHDSVNDEGLVLKESKTADEITKDDKESETNEQPEIINKDNLIKEAETSFITPETETTTTGEEGKDVKVEKEQ